MRSTTRSPARLGMTPEADRLYREALSEPNGIVLVTGPTGSG
jgi:general secretion pathway protein E